MKLDVKKIALYQAAFGLLFFPCCLSHYVLKIRAVRYQNPTDEDHNGGACDIIFSNCDVYFYFCIRNIHLSPSNADNCWDTITTSSSFESTDMTFLTTGQLYTGANTQNPLTFTSHNAWPGSFQLLVSSIDNDDFNDINSDDLIDRNAFNVNITPTDSWSNLITTSGLYNKVTFTIQVQLSCITGWTGNDCEQCILRAGCSLTNGRCTQPGECICNNGYTGINCTQPIVATATSFSPTPSTTATTESMPSNTNIATTTPSSSAATIFSSSSTLTPSPNSQSDQSSVVTIAGGAAACGFVILLIIVSVIVVSYCVIKSKNREKMKEAQRNEMPEPFNKNLMYMSPEVLDDK